MGTTTLLDSLQCVKDQGVVCMTGIVGNKWSMDDFSPMAAIGSTTCLTTYNGGPLDFMATPMQELVEQVEAGTLHVQVSCCKACCKACSKACTSGRKRSEQAQNLGLGFRV